MKKYKILYIIAILIVVGILLFFYRIYHNDVKALADFTTAYKKFNTAISDFSTLKTQDSESKASYALADLSAKAHVRISSLIKNDGLLMSEELVVADFSTKELDKLIAYQKAAKNKNTDLARLAKEYADLNNKRTDGYARFEELAK